MNILLTSGQTWLKCGIQCFFLVAKNNFNFTMRETLFESCEKLSQNMRSVCVRNIFFLSILINKIQKKRSFEQQNRELTTHNRPEFLSVQFFFVRAKMAKINYKFHVSKSFYSTFSLCSHIGELSQRALLVAFIFIFILYIYYCADTKVEPTNFSFQVKINIKISSKSIILFIFVIFFCEISCECEDIWGLSTSLAITRCSPQFHNSQLRLYVHYLLCVRLVQWEAKRMNASKRFNNNLYIYPIMQC